MAPSNERPNQHDYEQLETIYAHTDNETTVGTGTASNRDRGGQGRDHNSQKQPLVVVPTVPTAQHAEGVDAGEGEGLEGGDGQVAHLGVAREREQGPKNIDVDHLPRLVDEAPGEEGYGSRPMQSAREQVPPEEANAQEDSSLKKEEDRQQQKQTQPQRKQTQPQHEQPEQ